MWDDDYDDDGDEEGRVERWFWQLSNSTRVEITRVAVQAFDLVPCGGIDVRGIPPETHFVERGDPRGDNEWHLPPELDDKEIDNLGSHSLPIRSALHSSIGSVTWRRDTMRVDLRSAIQWRARRVVPAVLNRWAQYQLRRHGALDTLYAFHASQYRGAIAPEYADLWFLYHTVRIRKPLAVLEFGSGCSTVVMAQALTDNNYGQLYSVDADKSWAQSTRQAIPSRLQAQVQVSYSPLLEVQEKGVLGFRHVKVPNVAPNLIYLDGPELTAQRQVAFDVLDMEDRLPDDFMLIIDDRQENYAFLRRHLRYPYVVRRRFNGRFLKTETFERTRPPSIR